jgi:hypothetical protein
MPDSELFNGVESTNNSQAVDRTLARTPCCRHDARSTVPLTTDNSQHRRNGRESISSFRRREFRVRVRRKLTLRSVASVQGVHLNAGQKA